MSFELTSDLENFVRAIGETFTNSPHNFYGGWSHPQKCRLENSARPGWYLDIDDNGKVIINNNTDASGIYWYWERVPYELDEEDDNGKAIGIWRLRNLGNNKEYKWKYLDTVEEGRCELTDRGTGTYWLVQEAKELNGRPTMRLYNLGKSEFQKQLLDIEDKEVRVNPRGSGTYWWAFFEAGNEWPPTD